MNHQAQSDRQQYSRKIPTMRELSGCEQMAAVYAKSLDKQQMWMLVEYAREHGMYNSVLAA